MKSFPSQVHDVHYITGMGTVTVHMKYFNIKEALNRKTVGFLIIICNYF